VWPQLAHAMVDWDHLETRPVDQVIGAFFMIRRGLFEFLGGFDERFFVYFEEVDLALRSRLTGRRTMFLASVNAWHRGQGTTDQIRGRRLFYSIRSRLLYGRKHFSTFDRWVLNVVTWIAEPFGRVLFLVVRGRLAEVRHVAEAYGLLVMDRLRSGHSARV
jgi:N-acetylglucosaminyl-diphospho-decaprenol L-rhamnosyltransferase